MDQPAHYEIRIAEHLDERWIKWFGGLEIVQSAGSGETIFRGEMVDQPALFGVLGKIRDLGLTLVSVQRLGKVSSPLGLKDSASGSTRNERR
ncbi:MAG TPA: hypothetical protein VF932_08800 [Anaerolineae bacterium]